MKIDFQSFMVGCCLGDSSFEFRARTDTFDRISFGHKIENKDYVDLKKNILSENNIEFSELKGLSMTNICRFRISYSKYSELIETYYELTRNNDRSRKLPSIEYITPTTLFFWFLDDGYTTARNCKNKSSKISGYVRTEIGIALKSYADEDIMNLTPQINEKFGLNFTYKYDYYNGTKKIKDIILSKKKDQYKFLDLMYQFKEILPVSMEYKFCLCEIPKRNGISVDTRYNMCDVHETGSCTCREKDFSNCL